MRFQGLIISVSTGRVLGACIIWLRDLARLVQIYEFFINASTQFGPCPALHE